MDRGPRRLDGSMFRLETPTFLPSTCPEAAPDIPSTIQHLLRLAAALAERFGGKALTFWLCHVARARRQARTSASMPKPTGIIEAGRYASARSSTQAAKPSTAQRVLRLRTVFPRDEFARTTGIVDCGGSACNPPISCVLQAMARPELTVRVPIIFCAPKLAANSPICRTCANCWPQGVATTCCTSLAPCAILIWGAGPTGPMSTSRPTGSKSRRIAALGGIESYTSQLH